MCCDNKHLTVEAFYKTAGQAHCSVLLIMSFTLTCLSTDWFQCSTTVRLLSLINRFCITWSHSYMLTIINTYSSLLIQELRLCENLLECNMMHFWLSSFSHYFAMLRVTLALFFLIFISWRLVGWWFISCTVNLEQKQVELCTDGELNSIFFVTQHRIGLSMSFLSVIVIQSLFLYIVFIT